MASGEGRSNTNVCSKENPGGNRSSVEKDNTGEGPSTTKELAELDKIKDLKIEGAAAENKDGPRLKMDAKTILEKGDFQVQNSKALNVGEKDATKSKGGAKENKQKGGKSRGSERMPTKEMKSSEAKKPASGSQIPKTWHVHSFPLGEGGIDELVQKIQLSAAGSPAEYLANVESVGATSALMHSAAQSNLGYQYMGTCDLSESTHEEYQMIQDMIDKLAALAEKGVVTLNDWVEWTELPEDENVRKAWTETKLAKQAANEPEEEKEWEGCVAPFLMPIEGGAKVPKKEYEDKWGKGCCAKMTLSEMFMVWHNHNMKLVNELIKAKEASGMTVEDMLAELESDEN